MNLTEQITYTEIALRMLGMQFDLKSIEKIIKVVDLVKEKKGASNIEDVLKIKSEVK
jgi:hypothetical protein